jgi:iron complex transport system permease protein
MGFFKTNRVDSSHPRLPYGKWITSFAGLLVMAIMIFCVSCAFGAVSISPWTTAKILTHRWFLIPWPVTWSPMEETILLDIRVPRVLLALLAGISLATSGSVFQSLLRNPLADPFVIGVSTGAALGAIIAMAFNLQASAWGIWGIPLLSFAGGLLTILLILAIAQNRGKVYAQTLLLAGVIVNAFFSALIMFITSVMDPNHIQTYMMWLIGHLDTADTRLLGVCSLYVAIGWIILFSQSRALNALSFGEETAVQLGIKVESTKRISFVAAALMAGAVVSLSGIIGFIGLIIPHIIRSLVGSDHRILLPASAIGGGAFLMAADTVARTAIAPTELPVGVITALCGAPFFLYILRSKFWKHF